MSTPEELRAFQWRIDAMVPHLQDWISQYDFDFAATRGFDAEPLCDGRSSSGIILHPRQTWLHLLQYMMSAGMVEQEEREGVFYYRLAEMSNTEA